jgi:hypothetical protein
MVSQPSQLRAPIRPVRIDTVRPRNPSRHDEGRCPLRLFNQHADGLLPVKAVRPSAMPEPQYESLVTDVRAGLTPSDMVERKLMRLLRGAALVGSHIRMSANRIRGRANNKQHERPAGLGR